MVPLTASVAWAVALGCALGLGLWTIATRLPRLARPRLAARVAPYLVDVSNEARAFVFRASADPLPVLGVLGSPALRLFQAVFGSVLGVVSRTELLLRQAGDGRTLEAYRAQQLLWTLAGAGAGMALAAPLGAA